MITFSTRMVILTVLFSSFAIGGWGQVPIGTPPFGTYGGGPVDAINYGDLNVHISIPVVHKPGRGLAFNYDLVYESSIWNPMTSGSSKIWKAASGWGWAVSDLVPGYMTNSVTTSALSCTDGSVATRFTYSNWTYYDGNFTAHTFNGSSIGWALSTWGQCSQEQGVGFTGQPALDSSGYSLSAIGSSATITSVDGNYLIVPINPSEPSIGGSIVDRNGNSITLDYQTFTDTIGAKVLIQVVPAPPATSTYSYTSPSLSGTTGTVSVQKTFKSYLVETNFGCSGILDYGNPTPVSVPLVDKIILADNTFYQFTYEFTPGITQPPLGPPIVTGRLASVTLPSGSTVSYKYTGGPVLSGGMSTGINCADGTAAGFDRTSVDGTWKFATVIPSPLYPTDSYTRQLTVVDPLQNNTVLTFRSIYETDRSVYQGGVSTANMLVSTKTCYSSPNAQTCGIPPNRLFLFAMTDKTVTTTFPSGLYSTHYDAFNIWGRPMETDDYDYNDQPGPPLRKIVYTYPFLGSNIHAFWSSVDVQDGNGKSYSKTTYNYDESPRNASPTPPTGWQWTPGPWGNLTSIKYSNGLSKTYLNYVSGLPQIFYDVNGAKTGYAFNQCNNAYLSLINPIGSSNLQRSYTWDCYGGVQTQETEENGQNTNTAYSDPYFWRPASVTDPAHAITDFYYPNISQTEAKLAVNSGNSVLDILQTRDPLGRQFLSQRKQGPNLTSYDTGETDYDGAGNPYRVSTLYSSSAGVSNPNAVAKTVMRDALGRVTQITEPGGGTVTMQYLDHSVLVTATQAPTGEHAKQRMLTYDGLGRLVDVCEITTPQPYPWGTIQCGKVGGPVGYRTHYVYDPLGNLTRVAMNEGWSPIREQIRAYTYDSMSRLVMEYNAETGTTKYFYDKDSDTTVNCPGTYSGDLVKRVDAMGNVTCYTYDLQHRVLSNTYPVGRYGAVTNNKYFIYDVATVNGVPMANAKGRLAEAYTATTPSGAKITDLGYSYTTRGEISDIYQKSPNSGGYYHAALQYWENGATKQVTGLSTLPTMNYGLDAVGRISTINASTGQSPVTGTTYNAAGMPTQVNYGSGDSDSFVYDPNTSRMTSYIFNLNGKSFVGALTWNANGSLASQQISDPFNSTNTQNCSYSHDDFSRIVSVNCGSSWSQSFSYDPFGNLKKSGSLSFQPTYSLLNQMTALPGFTPTYDTNGNVLSDGSHVYTWNADGQHATVDGVPATYDALGRLVETGSNSEYFYLPDGSSLSYQGQTARMGAFKLPGGGRAVYDSTQGGLYYYAHSDSLGSARLISTPSRAFLSSRAYAPFGEPYAELGGTTGRSFTSQIQRFAGDLYSFPAREYSDQGRWVSPDPGGLASAHLENPQSWNRYAYAMNNPLSSVDPNGLDVCAVYNDATQGYDDVNAANEGECSTLHGTWIQALATDVVEVKEDAPNEKIQWLMDWWGAFKQINAQPLAVSLNRCAQKRVRELYNRVLKGNELANVFAGNTIADLTELATGPERLKAAGAIMVDGHYPKNPVDLTVDSAGKAIGQIPILRGTQIYAVDLGEIGGQQRWGTLIDRYVARRVKDLPIWGKAMNGALDVLDGKVVVDGVLYLGSEVACTAPAWQ